MERWARASEHGGIVPSTAGEATEPGSADPLGFSVSKNLTDQTTDSEGIQMLTNGYILLLMNISLLFLRFNLPLNSFQFCPLPWLQRKHL